MEKNSRKDDQELTKTNRKRVQQRRSCLLNELKSIIKESDFNQKQICQITGITDSNLSNILNLKKDLTLKTFLLILQSLNLNIKITRDETSNTSN